MSPDTPPEPTPAEPTPEEVAQMMAQITLLADELDDLSCMLSMRSDVVLLPGPPGSGWYFQPMTGLINADSKDLAEQSADFCRGLATHEAAHAAVTRYHDIVPAQMMRDPTLASLLNAIEDCRIEDWMRQRMPGCGPWVEEYNNYLFAPMLEGELPQTRAGQFCMSVIARWWYGSFPDGANPEVTEALEQTWAHVEEAIAAQPPSDAINTDAFERFYIRHPVARAYLHRDVYRPPGGFEMLVRMAQFKMWRIVFSQIKPAYDALVALDKKEHGSQSQRQQMQQLLEQMRGVPAPGDLPQSPMGPSQRRGQPSGGGGAGQPQPGGGGGGAGMADAIEQALQIDPNDRYLQTWNEISSLVDQLADQIAEVLEKASRSEWLRGYPSGVELDIRMAMQFQADRTLHNRLWMRKTMPKKVDPGFVLVVDQSGSMQGTNIDQAFKAVVLLVEVCKRVGIPTDIWTFANSAQLRHGWDDPLDEAVREKLGKVPQQCDGGTNMSGALNEVLARLPEMPFKDRIVIVIGDGAPNDGNASKNAIRALEAEECVLLGLGIGEGARAMSDYFQEGLFGVPVEQVAQSLATLIRDQVVG